MSLAIIQAAGLALIAATLLAMLLIGFERWAPARYVRERHDLALSVWVLVPLVFILALQPQPMAEPIEFLPDGIAATVEQLVDEPRAAIGGTGADASELPVLGSAADVLRQIPWASYALILWFAGMLVGFGRLMLDLFALSQLRASGREVETPASLELSQTVVLRRSGRIASPMLAGYLRPAIYLPEAFRLDQTARPVLEHEIAHLTRGDAWTVLALRALRCVFWWVAPLYWVERRLEVSRETLCDLTAARITGEPVALAHALLDTAEQQIGQPRLALAAGAKASSLASRIRYLASPEVLTARRSIMRFSLMLPVFIAAAVFATPKVGAEVELDFSEISDRFDRDFPLFQAASQGRFEEARALLEAGADPNRVSRGDGSPLFEAIWTRHDDIVELLLAYGADPNLAVRGDGSPMIAAARRGDVDVLALLHGAGGEIDAGVRGDGNPLIAAVQNGQVAAVDYLLEAGADPDAYVYADETPLIAAAQEGNIAIAERLLEAGADISLTVLAPMRDGAEVYRSPISEARRKGHRRMEDWLERWGAEHQPPAE